MQNNKKYIVILSVLLISILAIGRFVYVNNYQFNKVDEYVFEEKKTSDILKDCRKIYDNRYESGKKEDNILSLIKIVELNDYLLYKSEINSSVYYDLIKSILADNKRHELKTKDLYIKELESYISKKKMTGIEYLKLEISEPIFYEKSNADYAYAIVIKKINENEEYIKYNFIKENTHWYYIDNFSIKKINKVIGQSHE